MEPGCDRCNGATSPSFPSWTFRQPGYPFHFLWRRSPWPIGGSRCFSINRFFSACDPASRIETLPGQVSLGGVMPARSANRPLPRVGLIRPVLCPVRRSWPSVCPTVATGGQRLLGGTLSSANPSLGCRRDRRHHHSSRPGAQPWLHRQLLCGAAVCAVPAQ